MSMQAILQFILKMLQKSLQLQNNVAPLYCRQRGAVCLKLKNMTVFNLQHTAENPLYEGVTVTENNGRPNIDPSQASVAKIKTNAVLIASTVSGADRDKAVLTGAGPVWSYLAVQAAIGNYFGEVVYQDAQAVEFVITSKK